MRRTAPTRNLRPAAERFVPSRSFTDGPAAAGDEAPEPGAGAGAAGEQAAAGGEAAERSAGAAAEEASKVGESEESSGASGGDGVDGADGADGATRAKRFASSAPPRSWRDPSAWVDLEFESVGLDDTDADTALKSGWGSRDHAQPDGNVVWPHSALHEHRSRDFTMPKGAMVDGIGKAQLEENKERLSSLWRMSASHGISWDELDRAYISFADRGHKRYHEWVRRAGKGTKGESLSPEERAQRNMEESRTMLAVKEKRRALERAKAIVQRFCPEGEDPQELFPGHVRRVQSRLYAHAKRRHLSAWRPGRLTAHLKELVVAKMLRRETAERVHRLSKA